MIATSSCKTKFSIGFALCAMLTTWLVLGDNSPFKEYFLYHVTIPNLFRGVLIIPYLILMILRPTVFADAIGYILVFLQWLLVGYLFARLICRDDLKSSLH